MKPIVITGNAIPLSKLLAKRWRGARVDIDESGLLFVDVPARKDSFGKALATLRKVGTRVTKRDLTAALAAARQQHS